MSALRSSGDSWALQLARTWTAPFRDLHSTSALAETAVRLTIVNSSGLARTITQRQRVFGFGDPPCSNS